MTSRRRFLAGALHIEAGLPLALRPVHAVVEDAHRHHVAEHLAQRVGVELRVPRADDPGIVAEHADEVRRQRVRVRRRRCDIGLGRAARSRDFERREIGRVARPERRLGHMQREPRRVAAQVWILVAHILSREALSRARAGRQPWDR